MSLATVDRVVNRREGVREKTIARVEAAVAKLGYRADAAATRLARNQSFRFAFILPTGANTFMTNLAEQVRRTADWLAGQRAFIDVLHVDVFDPDALADALESLAAVLSRRGHRSRSIIRGCAPRSTTLRRAAIAVVTLVSDAPSSRRLHYVGIDNPAAGRTAATLMGRFLHGRTRHGRRHRRLARAARPCRAAVRLPPDPVRRISRPRRRFRRVEGPRRQRAHARRSRRACSRSSRDLVGLYSVGAGNRGIAAALEESGRARDIVWIAHELTVHTRGFLLRGVIDAIINQDPGHEARSAARVLLAHCWGDPIMADQERINIDIFLRDNLP